MSSTEAKLKLYCFFVLNTDWSYISSLNYIIKMGSTSSKFRKALQTGDEKTAEEIYHSSQEFQKSLDPNMSYGENYQHNTPLHYASRHGMHRLIR